MSNKSSANIEVRADGLYLVIDNVEGADKVTRKQVLDLVELFGVKDLSFETIQEIFKSEEMFIERKISENQDIVKKDEEIKVEIAKDRLSASISFKPAVGLGKPAGEIEILDALLKGNVKYGIDMAEVKRLGAKHGYDADYKIASAKDPVNGENGYLDFGFDPSEKKEARPELLENGNVDFRSLNLIEMVEKGQTLITFIPPKEGVDGVDVLGNAIPYKRGNPTPKVTKGQGVSVNENETEMIAETSGQVIYVNKKLVVNPILEIAGDVGPSTGNVKFNGSVKIRGNVMSGYSIVAEGDIDVQGTVEAANIESGNDVFMYNGVQGGDKATITAGGDINTKFAEGCTLKAGRNIVANSIMHSDVHCAGVLTLDGKNGNLVGGIINVGESVKAKVIGSSMATSTEIVVGNDPERLEEYNKLVVGYESKAAEFDKLDNLLQKLIDEHNSGKTNADKKNLLLKSLQVKAHLRKELLDLEASLEEMKHSLETKRGEIYAYTVIRSGVKVTIGNATMFIRDDVQNALLRNEGAKIVINSAV
ncbi:MAG: FapA family protein [Defluviitaleaceae bacterium]|nr:FapA family protein [Defluviitaleaceae bacterium]